MDKTIELNNVTKAYKNETVLDDLSLSVEKGCCYGFLGRNGSGKTTTIKIIMGLIRHDQGRVMLLDQDPWNIPKKVKERVGYVSEKQILPEFLRVKDLTSFSEKLYRKWNQPHVNDLLERFNIPNHKKIMTLSLGMKKFLALVLALGQDPELLVLDEPTLGLDPIARQEFIDNVMDLLLEEERTVFFSSHILSDVEKIADKIGILKKGRIFLEMNLDDMKKSFKQIQVDFRENPRETFDLPNIVSTKKIGKTVILTIKDFEESYIQRIQKHCNAEVKVLDMNFEQIFIELAK